MDKSIVDQQARELASEAERPILPLTTWTMQGTSVEAEPAQASSPAVAGGRTQLETAVRNFLDKYFVGRKHRLG